MNILNNFSGINRIMGRKWTGINYFVSIIYGVLLLVPVYFIFVSSFKANQQIFTTPMSLPTNWDFSHYFRVQERLDILGAMWISLKITLLSEIITLVFGFLAAFAIARTPGKLSKITEVYFITGFLIPTFAILVPVFLLAAKTGLLYEPIFIILFYSAARLPFTIIILTATISEIPIEMEEAAICDGANLFQKLWYIIFPLSRSGVVTVLILSFIEIWNEYLFALVLLNQKNGTVQRVLPMLRAERVSEYGLIAAALIISALPVVIVFVFFQEKIMSAMYSGGVKG